MRLLFHLYLLEFRGQWHEEIAHKWRTVFQSEWLKNHMLENPDVIGFGNLHQVVKKLSLVGQAMVKDYMSKQVNCVKEETPASDIAELMLHKDLKRVPVIRNKRLVGIVERSSLSSILLEEGTLE